ncbi:MAG: hypothetical protein JJU46_12400 [Balneolaceae bacterium]|nr:hypothetical protein [Balneolaceae bacterium]MCH8549403.1 hypothetical protein [Balneolaceae bacterium]
MKKVTTLLVAFLFTAGMAFAQNNEATIEQVGDYNEAATTQTGELNEATIEQLGNNSDITQVQTGDENTANALANGGLNATQTQIGDKNTATIDVESQTGLGNSTVTQYQEGDENKALFTSAGPGTNNANIEQSQWGNRNTSEITWFRSNPGGLAYTRQTGDDNEAYLDLEDARSTLFEVDQVGDFNRLVAEIPGNINRLFVSQTKDMNVATVKMLTNGNTVNITQNGYENKAVVIQN